MDEFSDVYQIKHFYDDLRERTFKSLNKAIEFMERNLYKVLLYDKDFKTWVMNEEDEDGNVLFSQKLRPNAYVKYKDEKSGKTIFRKLPQFLLSKEMKDVLPLYEESSSEEE